MTSAGMIHFELDPNKCVHFLGGEYTGYSRNVQRTLSTVKDHISPEDLAHTKQILLDNCPTELTFKRPLSNKMEMISKGFSKSFDSNSEVVKMLMNKEDRYSHVVPLGILICLLLQYLRHTIQTMVIKEDKNRRLHYNASTRMKPTDIIMNHVTPVM
jgi:hypothetical protein